MPTGSIHPPEELWDKYYRLNSFYHRDLLALARETIPTDASVLELGCRRGDLLAGLPNVQKTGIDSQPELVRAARARYPQIKFYGEDEFPRKLKNQKFDYILVSNYLSDASDIQLLVRRLTAVSHSSTRIAAIFFNYLWRPAFDVAGRWGLVYPQQKEPNWLSRQDIEGLFGLEDWEPVRWGRRFLCPYLIPLVSRWINKYLAALPVVNSLCLTNYCVFRPVPVRKDYSVSVVVPARNEAGNIPGMLGKIPRLGTKTEVIFVEGHSWDDTLAQIRQEAAGGSKSIPVRVFRQSGTGKGDAIRLGFAQAKHELLMILDADLTVDPQELAKFYRAVARGKGDLVMGSRLVYPLEKMTMRTLNVIGNKFFSLAFSFLLGQPIKDTLCGTKVLLKSDYLKIKRNRHYFGDFDPFGDFDLIFGAAKLNLKIVEIPVRYKPRTYGQTNISRFTHGWLLLKMVWFAARRLRFV